MKMLLFDMDGVLLEAQGYHRALQETVRQVASALGFAGVTLSDDVIAAFEASGMSSEWDSAATCSALLLQAAWRFDPQRQFPRTSLFSPAAPIRAQALDFWKFAISLAEPALQNLTPLERARHLLLSQDERLTDQQQLVIRQLLLHARQAEHSLTCRLFQELVLGSQVFARIYPFVPQLDTPSYLSLHDRSHLNDRHKASLKAWLNQTGNRAAILTSRPNLRPDDRMSTPEAELGADLVGLSHLPISGWGGLCWLGAQVGLDPQALLKPHPVHTLAAMQMALGIDAVLALEEATRLGWFGEASTMWQRLQGTEVSVFEDTPGGIRSLLAAQQTLHQVGVSIDIHCYGIARHSTKCRELARWGAPVYASLPEALNAAGVIGG